MSDRPNKDDLTLSPLGRIERICIEGVGKRDQLWVSVDEDGSTNTYFTWLDENYTVATAQQRLLQTALASGLLVNFHYQEVGGAKQFHAVTAVAP